MKRKKTLKVKDLIESANDFFLNSRDQADSERKILQIFVSDLLMKNGSYQGFNYLNEQMMAKSNLGKMPGIREATVPLGHPDYEYERFFNTDDTRIFFLG